MASILRYPLIAAASLIIVALFITAASYTQLAFAVILYPALVFLAFMIFPRKGFKTAKVRVHSSQNHNRQSAEPPAPKKETAYIADIDKRTFIKLIGATGISFFLISIFGRRVENLIFGSNPQVAPQPSLPEASPTDGYKISEIDEGQVSYYGFINKDGGWLIMREEIEGGSFRYAKGSSNFPANWQDREHLGYDYFYNLP